MQKGKHWKLKRDYELTDEQLIRREYNRKKKNHKKAKGYCVLVWYSENLENIDSMEYRRIMIREYQRQRLCAIRGYVGKTKPFEHFLFDFDLEKMLKDNIYYMSGNKRQYITKWWKGEIRHWTVKDGIWKE